MRHYLLGAILLVLSVPLPAQAGEPDAVGGHYQRGSRPMVFSHAVALRQDDVEKQLLGGPGLWVLLSDRAVPVEALEGGEFPPVDDMAKAGHVRGLLVQFDPADRTKALVTVLDTDPADPDASLATVTISDSEGLWTRLEVAGGRVVGNFTERDGMAFSFDTPIVENPVTQDLKGPAARSSPFAALIEAQGNAFAKGDMPAVLALLSAPSRARFGTVSPPLLAMLKAQAPATLAAARGLTRVVVRGTTATALAPDGSAYGFIREEGGWKIR
jgi:hypothetical protein